MKKIKLKETSFLGVALAMSVGGLSATAQAAAMGLLLAGQRLLARGLGQRGAFFDSTIDRFADALLFGGVALVPAVV